MADINRDLPVTIQCHCKLPAKLLTARNGDHAGENFYCCQKDMHDTSKCKFFRWSSQKFPQLQIPYNPAPITSPIKILPSPRRMDEVVAEIKAKTDALVAGQQRIEEILRAIKESTDLLRSNLANIIAMDLPPEITN